MSRNSVQTFNRILDAARSPWIIIMAGIALRVIRYLYNTPLWFDESVIASDIINRSFTDFIEPSPDYTQTGPLGFYLLTKLSVYFFGNSEYALRLIPLLFGIASLFLFYTVAKKTLVPGALPVGLLLFAVLDPLIYYSSELKPYSGDVACALLVLVLFAYRGDLTDIKKVILCSSAGLIALIMSNPSVFMLAGVGAAWLLVSAAKKEWSEFRRITVVVTVWLLGFAAIYISYTRGITASMAENVSIEKAFSMEDYFVPFPPGSLKDIKWYIDSFFDVFRFQDDIIYVKNVTLSGVMALAFLIGCSSMFSAKKEKLAVLMFPVLLTLAAAAMHQYPFKGRQILFLTPGLLLVIGEGAEYIRDKISKNSVATGAIFMSVLFVYPVSWAAYHVKQPLVRSEVRPVLNYISENWRDGDIIYAHFFAQYEMEYYTEYHPDPVEIDEKNYITGIGPRGWYKVWRKNRVPERYEGVHDQTKDEVMEEFRNDLNRLRGMERVWILFAGDATTEEFFLDRLDSMGRRIDSYGHSGLGITYLYDLSG